MIDKVLDRVVKQLDEKVGRLQEAVGAGAAKDFSEYQKMCGEVQGLLTARLFITDLKKNLEQMDDE
jgi:hypothetical protein